MSIARAKVLGRFDVAGGTQQATVEIEREKGLFTVRPHRRRIVYTLPLSMVAEMVCQKVIMSDLAMARGTKTRKVKRGLL